MPKSFFLMPLAGLEPARIAPLDFESSASANSATAAYIINPASDEARFDYITKKFTLQQPIYFFISLFPISKQSNVAK